MKRRPILHVEIVDDRTGKVLADIDAASVPDALAYYLTSRHIDDAATPYTVAQAAGVPSISRRPILRETRHPITNVVELALLARVH